MNPSLHLWRFLRPRGAGARAGGATPVRGLRRWGGLPGLALATVAMLAVLAAAGAGALLREGHWWLAAPVKAPPVTGCDALREACTARFADGATLTLRLAPQGLSAAAALRVVAQAEGATPLAVTLDLDGETMAMGPNHLDLQRAGDGRWQGEAALSACLSGPMAWVATLRLRSGWGERVARFRFVSGTP